MCFQVGALGVHLPATVEATSMSSPSSFRWLLTFELLFPLHIFSQLCSRYNGEWCFGWQRRARRSWGRVCDRMFLLWYPGARWVWTYISRWNFLAAGGETFLKIWVRRGLADTLLFGNGSSMRGRVCSSCPAASQKLIPQIVRLARWSQICRRDVGLILKIAFKLKTSLRREKPVKETIYFKIKISYILILSYVCVLEKWQCN